MHDPTLTAIDDALRVLRHDYSAGPSDLTDTDLIKRLERARGVVADALCSLQPGRSVIHRQAYTEKSDGSLREVVLYRLDTPPAAAAPRLEFAVPLPVGRSPDGQLLSDLMTAPRWHGAQLTNTVEVARDMFGHAHTLPGYRERAERALLELGWYRDGSINEKHKPPAALWRRPRAT